MSTIIQHDTSPTDVEDDFNPTRWEDLRWNVGVRLKNAADRLLVLGATIHGDQPMRTVDIFDWGVELGREDVKRKQVDTHWPWCTDHMPAEGGVVDFCFTKMEVAGAQVAIMGGEDGRVPGIVLYAPDEDDLTASEAREVAAALVAAAERLEAQR
jgi:hypothetical protein